MLTALYDSHCILCQQTRRMIMTFDWLHHIEFLDLHETDVVERRFPELDPVALMGEIHVIEESGAVRSGFQGMRRMLRELPLGVPMWLVLLLPGMNWLGPRVYGLVARHRYRINRLFGIDLATCTDGACKLPS